MVFGFGKQYDPDKDIPDLAGKVFFITGGNSGLGYEMISQIMRHNPAHIYMGARSAEKAEKAISSLQSTFPTGTSETPCPPITHIPLDLTDFSSVSGAVSNFNAQSSRLDVLVNNAGIMACPAGSTTDGYEIQFGTNHMGHALLTRLLLPVLQRTAREDGKGSPSRVVNVASFGHTFALHGIATDKAVMDAGNIWGRYGNSKLANILHAQGLAHNLHADDGPVIAVSVHPGVIYTDLYQHGAKRYFGLRQSMGLAARTFLKSVRAGAFTQTWCATADPKALTNGGYYTAPAQLAKGSWHARDEKQRDQLWEFTEKEITEKGY